jgi:WD40 repeat protein
LKVDSILRAANHSVFSLAYDSKNKHLYSGSRDAQLYKHSLDGQANQAVQIAAHLFTINDIVVSNELQMLFTASRDKTIKLWSLQNNKLLKVIDQKFDAHKNSVNKLLYLASRNLLISASDDSAVIAWHLQTEA